MSSSTTEQAAVQTAGGLVGTTDWQPQTEAGGVDFVYTVGGGSRRFDMLAEATGRPVIITCQPAELIRPARTTESDGYALDLETVDDEYKLTGYWSRHRDQFGSTRH